MSAQKQKGFTLIELLVVISIIAILSVVGLVSFQNIQSKAKDAKIKADLNAIKKAYEANYDPTAKGGQGGYKPLDPDKDFAGGKIPTPPGGGSYTYAYGPDNPNAASPQTDGYKISTSTPLSDNTTPTVISNQGTIPASQLNSCDPSGTLSTGLLTYWNFDKGSGDVVANSSSAGSSKDGFWNGSDSHWATTQEAKIGNSAGKFSGTGGGNGTPPGNYVSFNGWPGITGSFSVSFWIYPTSAGAYNNRIIGGNQGENRSQFFMTNDGNKVNFSIGYINGGTDGYVAVSVPTNEWTFITATFDGTTTKLSKNNTAPVTASFTHTFNGNPKDAFVMGKANQGHSSAQGYFAGRLDEVRVYSKVLTDSEIGLLASGCSP